MDSMQLHGFSDASEAAYAGVVYPCINDSSGSVRVSLVMSKTKVAPIKIITIPCLELLGAHLLGNLLQYAQHNSLELASREALLIQATCQ